MVGPAAFSLLKAFQRPPAVLGHDLRSEHAENSKSHLIYNLQGACDIRDGVEGLAEVVSAPADAVLGTNQGSLVGATGEGLWEGQQAPGQHGGREGHRHCQLHCACTALELRIRGFEPITNHQGRPVAAGRHFGRGSRPAWWS